MMPTEQCFQKEVQILGAETQNIQPDVYGETSPEGVSAQLDEIKKQSIGHLCVVKGE